MTERTQAISLCLLGVARKYHKKYCWVSQNHIIELVKKYEKLGFSRRTLNRDLRWLEDNGYISRVRRIRVGPDGKLIFASTLYKFTGKMFNWAYSLGKAFKNIFSFFRVPKWTQYQLSQKQVSSPMPASSVENLLITEQDGSVWAYDPLTGDLKKVGLRP